MGETAKGCVVRCPRGRLFRVEGLVSVCGIPAADLVRVRKDGVLYGARVTTNRVRTYNLPVSILEVVSCQN